MSHSATAAPPASSHEENQQHPIRLYLVVWAWLFILSLGSYLVDIVQFQGLLRWSLIVTLMLLKAGLIVSIFMHMRWERLALSYAILVPPVLLLVFVMIMTLEANHTQLTRMLFLNGGT
ncbi:cytochrome C oxidase subunit IV [Devosia limi DSM 17137]|uniref:Cytochrome C oxidase subunit IV n=1 Tax=Devosia limi DSM 17137 TaxID=1121477 RepID=A0A0F5LP06_9HYPH|nr:cytochrome C oxidase subunit IV family protein [Devosia limi]KKB83884.1 cytochrome C oxidase subunit IV [Devosia limi DSM 17137]SHE44697.1 Cytochrome c oxidase subunit IV [Devosia limi DSM 17137]